MQGPPIGQLKAISLIDMEPMMDTFLTASVLAALTTTRIVGIANQRVKECNRIWTMIDQLAKFGIETKELDDGLYSKPIAELKRGVSIHCNETVIEEKHCVEKYMAKLIGLKVEGVDWFYSAPAKTFEPEGARLPEQWESPQPVIASAISLSFAIAAVPSPFPIVASDVPVPPAITIASAFPVITTAVTFAPSAFTPAIPVTPTLLPPLPFHCRRLFCPLIIPVLPAITTAPSPTTATSLLASAYPAVISALSITPAISATFVPASVSLAVPATISVPPTPLSLLPLMPPLVLPPASPLPLLDLPPTLVSTDLRSPTTPVLPLSDPLPPPPLPTPLCYRFRHPPSRRLTHHPTTMYSDQTMRAAPYPVCSGRTARSQ
ncbi:hypothetical protein F5148DRAFT_1281314 [Russula earlei]|uniref:Uncharacterized protein n=1 Tax=Russula earlei TaxID=71964 RepID=A0ACC0UH35_9AGAM|nr:hypothetical protein F5148DRAFT_1281314 [Russula earlei]